MATLVVIDGANLVNDVGRYLTETAPSKASNDCQKAYFSSWFDIDRLVRATLGSGIRMNPYQDLGTVIVHSLRGVGRESSVYRIQGQETEEFWARQGSAENTSTNLVHIKGEKEKGVDTAIVVYLFETIDQWDSAVIFSRDSDFVPAVWALRRKGKRVYCAAPVSDKGSPLVQACQTFLPWDTDFLRADRALFEFLQPGSTLDQWLTTPELPQRPLVSVSIEPDGILVMPGRDGPGANVMNDKLRDTELFASEHGEPLLVRARRVPHVGAPQPIPAGVDVFDGLRRTTICSRAHLGIVSGSSPHNECGARWPRRSRTRSAEPPPIELASSSSSKGMRRARSLGDDAHDQEASIRRHLRARSGRGSQDVQRPGPRQARGRHVPGRVDPKPMKGRASE